MRLRCPSLVARRSRKESSSWCCRLQSKCKHPPLDRRIRAKSALMASDRCMDFVSLNELTSHSAHVGIKHAAALLSDSFKQGEHRLKVYLHKSGDGTQTRSFHHQRDYSCCFFGRDVVRPDVGMKFAKCDLTRATAIALNFTFAIRAKTLRVTVVTLDARHWVFSLTCGAEKAHNSVRVLGCGSYPRRGLTPQSSSRWVRGIKCWGDCSVLSEFPRSLGACSKSHELQSPYRGGIQGFATENAPVLFANHWWWSDAHSSLLPLAPYGSLRCSSSARPCAFARPGFESLYFLPRFFPLIITSPSDTKPSIIRSTRSGLYPDCSSPSFISPPVANSFSRNAFWPSRIRSAASLSLEGLAVSDTTRPSFSKIFMISEDGLGKNDGAAGSGTRSWRTMSGVLAGKLAISVSNFASCFSTKSAEPSAANSCSPTFILRLDSLTGETSQIRMDYYG